MTYILGIKKEDTAYIVGDSVITSTVDQEENFKKIPILHNSSSFGEKTIKKDLTVIQESTKKIYKTSDDIAIAFAGNAREAYEVIENIKDLPSLKENPIGCIEHFTRHNPNIQLLVTVKKLEANVEMYAYNVQEVNKVIKCEESEFVHLGCLDNEFKDIVENVAKVVLSVKHPEIDADLQRRINLKLLCAFLQTFQYHDTIKNGIGGTYFGIEHCDFPRNLDDTAYMMVSGNNINTLKFSLIGLFNREDRTIVNSPFLDKPFRILETYIPPEKIREISARNLDWLQDSETYDDIHNKINSITYQDYIFLHQNDESGKIKILYVPNFESRTKELFEIKGKTIKPIAQEFLDKIGQLIDNSGELIDVL